MTDNQAPDGMIPAEKFARMKGLTTDKVIAMVKDGFYVGRVVGEQWYVDLSEASGSTQKANTSTGPVAYESDYGLARIVSKFMSFLGWLVFGSGILAALIVLSAGMEAQNRYGGGGSAVSLLALLPGLGVAISGLFLIAAAQVTRATVDNADHTREILKVLNNKA